MTINTTSIALSTTPVVLISSATTWAHLRGANASDPVPFQIFNPSTSLDILIGGNLLPTQTGFPIGPRSVQNMSLYNSDPVFGFTTSGSTGTAIVLAGRQQ